MVSLLITPIGGDSCYINHIIVCFTDLTHHVNKSLPGADAPADFNPRLG